LNCTKASKPSTKTNSKHQLYWQRQSKNKKKKEYFTESNHALDFADEYGFSKKKIFKKMFIGNKKKQKLNFNK